MPDYQIIMGVANPIHPSALLFMRTHPTSTLLCVVDIQERLLGVMPAGASIVNGAFRLAAGARLLGVRSVLFEQYPKGLGPTPAKLASLLPPPLIKMSLSGCGCEAFCSTIDATIVSGVDPAVSHTPSSSTITTAVLCGLETHVCITQTALDLLARGLIVFIAVDSVGSRHTLDHDVGLRRLEAAGAILTTSEAVLFEWCGSAEHPQFQAVRNLVLERVAP